MPAVIRVVDQRTIIKVGENTTAAARYAREAKETLESFPNYFKGDKGDPGAAGNVAAGRAQLSAATASQGDIWYLNDLANPLASGFFEKLDGDRTALVTSDPQQGIYIPAGSATDGSTGVWRREVSGKLYKLDWWQPTSFGDLVHVALTTIAALLPTGATLLWGDNQLLAKGNCEFRKSICIVGIDPDRSRLTMPKDGPLLLSESRGLLNIRAGNTRIAYMGFGGQLVNANANQNAIIDVLPLTGEVPVEEDLPIENVIIEWCRFENTNAPILGRTAELVRRANEEADFRLMRNFVIRHNEINTSRYGAIFFGVDDIDFYSNDVRWADSTAQMTNQAWTAGVRLLGCKRPTIRDNHFALPYVGPNKRHSMVRLDQFGYHPELRRHTVSPRIYGNTATGGDIMYDLLDGGDVYVSNNKWTNPVNDEIDRVVWFVAPSGNPVYGYDKLTQKADVIEGASRLFRSSGGHSNDDSFGRIFRSIDTAITRNRASESTPWFLMEFPLFYTVDLIRLDYAGKKSGADIKLLGGSFTSLLLTDCTLPEETGGGFLDPSGGSVNAEDPTLKVNVIAGGTSYPVAGPHRRQVTGMFDRTYPTFISGI